MKPTAIRINRLELRVRGGLPRGAQLAQEVARQIALRGAATLPGPLTTSLGDRLATTLANARRK